MNIIFVHQNFPGQFKHLAAHFGASPHHRVWFITKRKEVEIDGVQKVLYQTRGSASASTHQYLRSTEDAVWHGQAVAETCLNLKNQGVRPDIIVAHPGWGEALYIKDAYPDTPLLNYFEFYFHAAGADVNFDPEYPSGLDKLLKLRTRNALFLMSLQNSDWGLTPTRWQWQQHPAAYRDRISVIHEGVDTEQLQPAAQWTLTLPDGAVLSRNDEVITYVSRNLEPYRGFHQFMRALQLILKRRPNARVLVVGGDEVSYGSALADGQTYRQRMIDELGMQGELDRVYFLGRLPYKHYLAVLRVSSVHLYLTYPFVLSWSVLEAMALGCLLLASATPPVEEVITDNLTGLLVDFFDPQAMAERVDEVFAEPQRMAQIRTNARAHIVQHYDLRSRCLPAQLNLIGALATGAIPN